MATSTDFRLESVLAWRVQQRDNCRQALVEVQQAAALLQQQLQRLTDALGALHERQRAAFRHGAIELNAALPLHRYQQTLRAEMQSLRGRGRELAQQIELRHQELVEADRQVKVLEKLRAEHERLLQFSQQRRERLQLDETAGNRHHQRQSASS